MKIGAAIVAVGAVALLTGCSSPPQTLTPHSTTTPTTPSYPPPTPAGTGAPDGAGSVLVFSMSSPTTDITTFVRLNGTTLKTISSRDTDSTFSTPISDRDNYIGYSSALLTSNELYPSDGAVAVTNDWALLAKDGSVQQLPAASIQFLNQSRHVDTTPFDPGIFVTETGSLFVAVESPSGVAHYDQVDLTSGQVTTLFTVRSLTAQGSASPPELFSPQNLTPSGDRISFLAANVSLTNQNINGLAVVTYDVAAATMSIRHLSSSIAKAILPSPTVSAFALSAFVSADGSLLVYQTASVVDGSQVFVTHIYHIATGRDVILPGSAGVAFGGGANPVIFSPDNAFAAMAGGNRLIVAATSTGAIVKTVDVPASGGPSIVPLGWTSSAALVYVTVSSSGLEGESAHSVDPATGMDFAYPTDLGELIAVLY